MNRHIPRDFATICLKCLERDPNRRYGGAGVVAAELRRFLAGEPIQARPLAKLERLWRWTKRKPAVATAAALAAVVMVAGPVTALVINSQRNALAGRVRELDKLVIGQEETTRALRGENAELQLTVDAMRDTRSNRNKIELADWRRALIADVLDRHYSAAVAALKAGKLDSAGRTRVHLGLAMMLARLGRGADAIEHFTAARSLLEELAARTPGDRKVQSALADCYEQLALLYQVEGNESAMQDATTRALESRTFLAESGQGVGADVQLMASYFDVAPAMAADNPSALEASLNTQRRLAERVVNEWPTEDDAIYEAACRLTNNMPVLSAPRQSEP